MARNYMQFLQDHWERISGEPTSAYRLKPFFPVAAAGEDEQLKWFGENLDILRDEAEERARKAINYTRFYNACVNQQLGRAQITDARSGKPINRPGQYAMNHARDFVRQFVARMLADKDNINVFPQNNEYQDRLGARLSKHIIDHVLFVNDFESHIEEVMVQAKITGESFLFVEYDPNIGDLDPMTQKAIELQQQGDVREYTQIMDAKGEVINLDIVKRVGEVKYSHPITWFVLHEPQFRWRDVNYIYRGTVKHVDEIAAENPGINLGDLTPINIEKGREGSYGPGFQYGEWVIEWDFFHRFHPFLGHGYYCRFIENAKILKAGPLPYSHGELPVARMIDIHDPEQAHGTSFFDDIGPPLVLHNKLMNLQYRNIATVSHPKIFVPEGTCNINSLANGPMVVEYQYPMKPEIAVFPAIPGDVFNFNDRLMNQITQLSGTFNISRGETIPNARAASILGFYEDQEKQNEGPVLRRKRAFVEKVGRLSLGTAGDFYQPDDGRTIRTVGKNNRYKLIKLEDTTKLSGPYNVEIEATSAIADMQQARIERIASLSQVPLAGDDGQGSGKPGLFTREQILNMIEVGDTPTFFEMATAAVQKADSENEDLFEGVKVPAPEQFDAHLVHWNVHYQFMQSREFTDVQGLPPEVRQAYLDHLRAHEAFMYEHARTNIAFCSELIKNAYFPAVLDLTGQLPLPQVLMVLQAPAPGTLPPEPPKGGATPPGPSDNQDSGSGTPQEQPPQDVMPSPTNGHEPMNGATA